MEAAGPCEVRCGLILKGDRFYAAALRTAALLAFPAAHFAIVNRLDAARHELRRVPIDLLLSGVELMDGDVFELLAECTRAPRRVKRVLVVTGRREQQVLASLQALPIDGVFDPATEEPEDFVRALQAVAGGERYWSQSLRGRLLRRPSGLKSGIDGLTPTERLVFAVIGDGCDDDAAAERLALSASTVQSIRRGIHRKLGVQHKGDLVRLAAQYGFVWLTADAVVRPGLSLLKEAREARRQARHGETTARNE